MIRQLPARFALVIRGGLLPVVVRLPMAWQVWAYRKARRGGWAVYQAPVRLTDSLPVPDLTPVQPVPAHQPEPGRVLEPVPVPAGVGATAQPLWRRGHHLTPPRRPTGTATETGTVMPDSTAGLAALVYKLQKRLDSLQDAVNSHSGLATDLADLTQRVRTLIAAGKEQPAPPAPVWFGLSKEEFGAQLRELAGCVEPHLRATMATTSARRSAIAGRSTPVRSGS